MFLLTPCLENNTMNLHVSEKDLNFGWTIDTMGKTLNNSWKYWVIFSSRWNTWFRIFDRRLCYMKFKSILLFSGTKGILYGRKKILLELSNIFSKHHYLDQVNILFQVYSTCLFSLGNNRKHESIHHLLSLI